MANEFEDDATYEPDTPEAVLRCAIAVACVDGEFAHDEQERVRAVYGDICQEMTFSYNQPEVSDEYEEISQSTSDLILSMDNLAEKLDYIEECGKLVTDKDLRELTLVMGLRVAGGDAELHRAEFQALKRLADLWRIRLSDILEPYLN